MVVANAFADPPKGVSLTVYSYQEAIFGCQKQACQEVCGGEFDTSYVLHNAQLRHVPILPQLNILAESPGVFDFRASGDLHLVFRIETFCSLEGMFGGRVNVAAMVYR